MPQKILQIAFSKRKSLMDCTLAQAMKLLAKVNAANFARQARARSWKSTHRFAGQARKIRLVLHPNFFRFFVPPAGPMAA
jgi:hypothetical protein